jgi:hypothetical protein
MEKKDRLNQIMESAIHMLDDLLESRPRIPAPVVDLVHWTLTGTAHVIEFAVDRGLSAANLPPEKTA